MSIRRSFPRRFDALAQIFAFTAEVASAESAPIVRTIDFVLEELFTNIVKYARGTGLVHIEIAAVPGGLEVLIEEPDAERFDVTQAPDADVHLPIEQRQPGGLGLHLIRRMVDSIEYQYSENERLSRTRFRKTLAPSVDSSETNIMGKRDVCS